MKAFPFRLHSPAFGEWPKLRGRTLYLSFFLLAAGILAGSCVSGFSGLLAESSFLPLFFSGIPVSEAGFISCFSTFLLNLIIFLTLSFFLGVTAFGFLAFPLLTFFRGITVGLGVSSFLWMDGPSGLGRCMLIYAPGTAASLLLFVLFGAQALAFSDRFRRAGFSSSEESLDFRQYLKDYLRFLCLSVVVSLLGAVPAALGAVFFS